MAHNASRRWILGAAAAFFLSSLSAQACNVPVYRYALERWQPDPYGAIVFHRGALAPEDQEAITRLRNAAKDPKAPANIEVVVVDLDKEKDPAILEFFKTLKDPVLPWLVVRYPIYSKVEEDLYAGPLQKDVVQGLLDSSTRREVARLLMSGQTGVWILLESGDKDKDQAAARLLGEQAKALPGVLKLPEQDEASVEQVLRKDSPLRIAFSQVRLSRTDPAESMFVHMLLHTEPDLAGMKEPMVFTVFGRGRSLFALVGAGINEDTIQDDGQFLVGPCSCEVKRQNPGVDLLFAADWEAGIGKERLTDPVPPSLVGLSNFLPEEVAKPKPPELPPLEPTPLPVEPTPPGQEESPAVESSPPTTPPPSAQEPNQPQPAASDEPEPAPRSASLLVRNVLLAVLVGLAVVAAFTFAFRGKGRNP
jgi:hypothetical protein